MYSYELLEPGCHYLIQEEENAPVMMIKIAVESDHCMFVCMFGESESTGWKKKSDPIFDIIELLSETTVKQWESLYNNNQDAFNYEDEEE